MNLQQMKDAFRFVRRWNIERGYWSRADALEFEAAIGGAVTSGDRAQIDLYVAWLTDQLRQIDELIAGLEPQCRAMEKRVKTEMRDARKVGIG